MAHTTSEKSQSHNRTLGARGEALAAEYLQSLGYEVLDRNWRSGRTGELDLVAVSYTHLDVYKRQLLILPPTTTPVPTPSGPSRLCTRVS